MTQLVAATDAFGEVSKQIFSDGMQKQLGLACTKNITPERIARVALTLLRGNAKLLDAAYRSPATFYGALMTAAQLGLEPGPMGLSYLIPYKNKGVPEVQFQVGYKGLLNLVWRSELISSIQAEVVYEGDHFQYRNGIPPELEHVPSESREDDAKPTHAYCVIGTTAGGWIFRVMTFNDIEKLRKKYSKSTRPDSPWVTSWNEMACKTVMKRTGKRAPVSAETQRAIALDDLAEIGIAQDIGDAIVVEGGEVPPSMLEEPPDGDEFDLESDDGQDAAS